MPSANDRGHPLTATEPSRTSGGSGLSRFALAALVLYTVFVLWTVLWPSASPASHAVDATHHLLQRVGLTFGVLTDSRVEFLLNALMVAPVTFLMLLWRGGPWQKWTAYGFVVSGLVELSQGLFLPDRSASTTDVVANTTGALLGALAGAAVVRFVPRRDAS